MWKLTRPSGIVGVGLKRLPGPPFAGFVQVSELVALGVEGDGLVPALKELRRQRDPWWQV